MNEGDVHLSASPQDAPDAPAAGRAGKLGQAVVLILALLALVWISWQGYRWLQDDAQQRRAVAEGRAALPGDAEGAEADAASVLPALDARPAVPVTAASAPDEPRAPAVAGEILHKCLEDGRIVFSRRPCPEGTEVLTTAVTGLDAQGVQGRAGDPQFGLPSASTSWSRAEDNQRAAACAHLSAEIERLEFEFAQALPPPVLDHVSTRLGLLRSRSQDLRCPQAPQGGARN